MKQGRKISFYIELAIMLILAVLAITVLANAFSVSEAHSRAASRLSAAVTLASSGAECFIASDDPEELLSVLNEADNARLTDTGTPKVEAYYDDDMNPDGGGNMKMVINWDEKNGFVNGYISVYYNDEAIYDLETGFARAEVER